MAERLAVFAAVDMERRRQHDKWGSPHTWGAGDCSSPHVPELVKLAVLHEECGEVARALLEQDPEQLATELVQVAAVAVAWLEGMQ